MNYLEFLNEAATEQGRHGATEESSFRDQASLRKTQSPSTFPPATKVQVSLVLSDLQNLNAQDLKQKIEKKDKNIKIISIDGTNYNIINPMEMAKATKIINSLTPPKKVLVKGNAISIN